MIIGTAGHIDHGKTTLVRALTGVDTDRLAEERRRGITIELGFAPIELAGVGTCGIVDVPGHEAFVRTMVAGATGIDLALLVVAADEGVMPQTREHLAILTLLGTRGGVVALTKCDLVDDEWLALVRTDVADAIRGTPLEGAAIVATSSSAGRGLDELRQALAHAAAAVPARDADDIFRMPVDRAFSVRGTGTVVTGTVWSGTIARDSTLSIQPGGREVRVRGVQSHGRDVAVAGPATRAAIALAGVDVGGVPRGSWLVGDPSWHPSPVMRAEVALLSGSERPLRPREWIRLHLGTADVAARIVAPGGPVAPGERRAVRIVLQEPVIARSGDRFVLRQPSPVATIGGGVVIDPAPPGRRPKAWHIGAGTAADRLELMLEESGWSGLHTASLPMRLGLRPSQVASLLAESPGVQVIDSVVFAAGEVMRAGDAVASAVDRHHASHPLEDGIPISTLRSQLQAHEAVLRTALGRLADEGRIVLRGSVVSRAGWQPRLTQSQEALREVLLEELRAAGAEPPTVSSLAERHHSDVTPLLRMLERAGLAVAVESDRYYSADAVRRLVAVLRDGMTRGREYSPAELRDLLGVSRKYLIPLLEFCDRQRITERRVSGRVLLDS